MPGRPKGWQGRRKESRTQPRWPGGTAARGAALPQFILGALRGGGADSTHSLRFGIGAERLGVGRDRHDLSLLIARAARGTEVHSKHDCVSGVHCTCVRRIKRRASNGQPDPALAGASQSGLCLLTQGQLAPTVVLRSSRREGEFLEAGCRGLAWGKWPHDLCTANPD